MGIVKKAASWLAAAAGTALICLLCFGFLRELVLASREASAPELILYVFPAAGVFVLGLGVLSAFITLTCCLCVIRCGVCGSWNAWRTNRAVRSEDFSYPGVYHCSRYASTRCSACGAESDIAIG